MTQTVLISVIPDPNHKVRHQLPMSDLSQTPSLPTLETKFYSTNTDTVLFVFPNLLCPTSVYDVTLTPLYTSVVVLITILTNTP